MREDAFGSADDYYRALTNLEREGLTEKQRSLLRVHLEAPEQGITWAELAGSVGYKTGGSVNLQYGTLARRVALQLGVDLSRVSGPGLVGWLSVLIEIANYRGKDGHRVFVLRPSVVAALRRMASTESRTFPRARSSRRPRPGSSRPFGKTG